MVDMTPTTQQTNRTELTEVRLGRFIIRLGDTVKLTPAQGRSFRSAVRRITEVGDEIEVEVIHPATRHFRTFTLDRVTHLSGRKQETAR